MVQGSWHRAVVFVGRNGYYHSCSTNKAILSVDIFLETLNTKVILLISARLCLSTTLNNWHKESSEWFRSRIGFTSCVISRKGRGTDHRKRFNQSLPYGLRFQKHVHTQAPESSFTGREAKIPSPTPCPAAHERIKVKSYRSSWSPGLPGWLPKWGLELTWTGPMLLFRPPGMPSSLIAGRKHKARQSAARPHKSRHKRRTYLAKSTGGYQWGQDENTCLCGFKAPTPSIVPGYLVNIRYCWAPKALGTHYTHCIHSICSQSWKHY